MQVCWCFCLLQVISNIFHVFWHLSITQMFKRLSIKFQTIYLSSPPIQSYGPSRFHSREGHRQVSEPILWWRREPCATSPLIMWSMFELKQGIVGVRKISSLSLHPPPHLLHSALPSLGPLSFASLVSSPLSIMYFCSGVIHVFTMWCFIRCPGSAWLKHISFSRLRFPRAITCAQPEIPDPSPLCLTF